MFPSQFEAARLESWACDERDEKKGWNVFVFGAKPKSAWIASVFPPAKWIISKILVYTQWPYTREGRSCSWEKQDKKQKKKKEKKQKEKEKG
jgi:hypothetical protein